MLILKRYFLLVKCLRLANSKELGGNWNDNFVPENMGKSLGKSKLSMFMQTLINKRFHSCFFNFNVKVGLCPLLLSKNNSQVIRNFSFYLNKYNSCSCINIKSKRIYFFRLAGPSLLDAIVIKANDGYAYSEAVARWISMLFNNYVMRTIEL